jgi:hypothetical protein
VTCYMRHLTGMFELLGLESDQTTRKRVDAALKPLLGLEPGAHCPEVWAAYKALSEDERDALVPGVRTALGL